MALSENVDQFYDDIIDKFPALKDMRINLNYNYGIFTKLSFTLFFPSTGSYDENTTSRVSFGGFFPL